MIIFESGGVKGTFTRYAFFGSIPNKTKKCQSLCGYFQSKITPAEAKAFANSTKYVIIKMIYV